MQQAAARPILPEDICSTLGSWVEGGLWGHVILRDSKNRGLLPSNSPVPLGKTGEWQVNGNKKKIFFKAK